VRWVRAISEKQIDDLPSFALIIRQAHQRRDAVRPRPFREVSSASANTALESLPQDAYEVFLPKPYGTAELLSAIERALAASISTNL